MITIPEILIDSYQDVPDQIAIHLLYQDKPPRAVSYHQLFLGSVGFAQALKEANIQPGEVVILILDHGEDLVYAFFGSILHGAIPSIMPFLTEKLSPEKYRQSLQALIEITSPGAIVTDQDFINDVELAINVSSSIKSVLSASNITR
jgi:acyl-CoA synthetase (AMP-forming)/AMP-acid ligase II